MKKPKTVTVKTKRRVAARKVDVATGYANLRWSAEQPAADGWWWWKPRPNAPRKPAEIWSITSAGVVLSRQCAHPNGILALENMSAAYPAQRWAGPLPEPEEEPLVESSHTDPKLSDGGAWRGSCEGEAKDNIRAREKGGRQ